MFEIKNPNICRECALKAQRNDIPTILLFSKSLCGVCDAVIEVYDADLLKFYKEYYITDDTIWKTLPTLRIDESGDVLSLITLQKIQDAIREAKQERFYETTGIKRPTNI